jgi:hypothetical protein
MVSERMRRAGDRRQKDIGGQEASPGYAVNGTSQWERHSAEGRDAVKAAEPRIAERQEWSRLDVLILNVTRDLERIERKLVNAETPERAGRYARDQEIKMRFLAKLRAEQRSLAP